jgi:copper chaperone CopZ
MTGFEKQELTIDGMHCDACVRRVTQTLGSIPGVRVTQVEVGRAEVMADKECEDRIRTALGDGGFSLKGMHGKS